MKPMPDADEHRRLGKVEAEKALSFRPGSQGRPFEKGSGPQIQCAFEGLEGLKSSRTGVIAK